MNINQNCFITKPLLIKWIFTSFLLLPLSVPCLAESVEINKINELHEQLVQTQVQAVVKKVDQAIFAVIKLPDRERLRFATLITLSCKKYDLDPRIMVAILKVESDFKQKAVSNTGDYSVAQINFKIWAKKFRQLDKAPLEFNRLKEDDAYAIFRMGEILHQIKLHHAKTDQFWFARYHSATPKFKNAYIKKLQIHLKKLLPFGPNLLEDLPDYQKIMASN